MNRELTKRLAQLVPKRAAAKPTSKHISIDQVPVDCFFVEATADGRHRFDDPVYYQNSVGEFSSSCWGGDSFLGIRRNYFSQKLLTIVSKPSWIG